MSGPAESQGGAGLEVHVDATRCVGSGNCEYWAPGIFEVGDDGVAVVIGEPSQDPEATATAVESCPTRALRAT